MDIEQMIHHIKQRPAMYVGSFELKPVVHFVIGFLFERITSGRATMLDISFKKNFSIWVKEHLENTQGICLENGRNYYFYINKIYEEPEECLKVFFELSDMFFLEIKQHDNLYCDKK